tara:strand:- start:1644 stop:1784 length:141 start_codon:yes stop_codon:yes gene_type:complete
MNEDKNIKDDPLTLLVELDKYLINSKEYMGSPFRKRVLKVIRDKNT